MDGARDCHTELSKSDKKEKYLIIFLTWNLKRNDTNELYLQNRNILTDLENDFMVTREKGGREGELGSLGWTGTHCYILNEYPTRTYYRAQGTLLNIMQQPGWKGGWGRMDARI